MAGKAIAKTDPRGLAKLATRINAEHQACEGGVRDGVCHALEAGRLLTEAKAGMRHGEWLPWLEESFEGTDRIAQYYIKANAIVVTLGLNAKSISDMSLSEVLALLSPKQLAGPRDSLTGEVEWYTPKLYVEAARKTMGSIDLDPASCKTANKTVKAKKYYNQEDNGLGEPWYGNVFLNPPYKAKDVAAFVSKLCDDVATENVEQAVLLTNNATDAQWWHRAARECAAICLTKGRISFENSGGVKNNPPNGHSFFYFGERVGAFVENFTDVGILVQAAEEAVL